VSLIQRGDIANRLIRRFGLKQRSPAPELNRSVQPVVIVDDIRESTEYEFRTSRHCMGSVSVGALAANNSQVSLKNPTGSGIIARVRQLWISSEALSRPAVLLNQGTLTTLFGSTVKAFLDSRLGIATSGVPICQLRSLQSVAAPGPQLLDDHFLLAATVRLLPHVQIILNPGDQLTVHNQTLNASIFATYYWVETNAET